MKNTVRVLRGKQQRTTTLCVEVVKKQPDELKQTKRSTRPNICRKYNVNYLHTQYYHICIYNMNVLYSCMSAFSIKSYGFWTKLVLLFLGAEGRFCTPPPAPGQHHNKQLSFSHTHSIAVAGIQQRALT